MGFSVPSVEVSPATDQVVGVPTWLAVTSQLDFAPVGAEAGDLWARATPIFDRAVWEFGNGDGSVECDAETDVTTVWDPELGDDQVSQCIYTFLSNEDGVPFEGEVTVYWDIYFESSDTGGAVENGGAFQFWDTWTEPLAVTFNVRELQAVID